MIYPVYNPILMIIVFFLALYYMWKKKSDRKAKDPFLVGKVDKGVVTWKDEVDIG